MKSRSALVLALFLLLVGPAAAQNVTCATRPTGDNSNACASTAFVQGATASNTGATFTGGLVSVSGSPVSPVVTLAFTVAGTSGGIPYFASGTSWASSDVLAANAFVLGGGAGAAPATTTTGAGVVTAVGIAPNASGGMALTNGSITVGNLTKWSATGVQDAGLSPSAIPYINVLDNTYGYEAVGDCSTDDGPAINSLIDAIPAGAAIFFPPAPGGCYAIATIIVWPDTKPISFIGTSSGDDSTCELRWTGGAGGRIIEKSDVFTRGGLITNMVLNGNGVAEYNIYFEQAAAFTFDNLSLLDATITNMVVGDGVTNTQENRLNNLRIDNQIPETLDDLPAYNLILEGTNNDAINVKLSNAELSNLLETGAVNSWVSVHGYNYLNGETPLQPPSYNIETYALGSQYTNWETDGATVADFRVGGYQVKLENGFAHFDGVTAEICIKVDNNLTGVAIVNNTLNGCSLAESIVYSGGNTIGRTNWVDTDNDFVDVN